MGTTPKYAWPYPDPSDLVRDAPQAFEDLADAIEATVSTKGVLQVVSTAKTDTFTTTSSTYTDITGLTAAITPSGTASKVLVVAHVNIAPADSGSPEYWLRLNGGNADDYVGAAAGSRTQTAGGITRVSGGTWPSESTPWALTLVYLDSPASTATTTYAVQALSVDSATFYVNRTASDTDSAAFPRLSSSITVMEVGP